MEDIMILIIDLSLSQGIDSCSSTSFCRALGS